jgi:uncharacterized protein (DUF2225 family)
MTSNLNQHLYGWLEKIQANINIFKEKTDVSDLDRIEFISHQYHLVMIIYQALNKQVIFVGARIIE